MIGAAEKISASALNIDIRQPDFLAQFTEPSLDIA
jgi:hypothetical protein